MALAVRGQSFGEMNIGAAGPDSASQANDARETLNDGFQIARTTTYISFVTAV